MKNKVLDSLLIILTYIVLLKPYYLIELNVPFFNIKGNQLFAILQIALLLFFLILKLKSKKINKIEILIILIIFVAMLSNIINGHNLYFVFNSYINFILTYLFITYELKSNLKNFLRTSCFLMFALLCINVISIILKPVDYLMILTRVHFLGYDNDSVPIVFAFILCFLINLYMKNGLRYVSTLGIIVAIVDLLLTWSANGVVGLFLLIIYLLFFRKVKTNKIYNYRNVLIISIIAFFLIVVFRFQNYFEYIIVDLLNRDLTFTGRTVIWDRALNLWKSNKILGLGVFDFIQRRTLYGVYHAHCTYLNILFETGLCGFILRIYFYLRLNDKIKKYATRISGLIIYFFIIYFTITLVEVYVNDFLFYMLLGFILNIDLFHEGGKLNES